MVEGAIVAPVVFFLVFAIFQAAFLGRAYIATRDAAAAGVRVASVDANLPVADYDIIQGAKLSMQTSSSNHILKIIVFKATDTEGRVPDECLAGPVTGLCNVYDTADLNHTQAEFESLAVAQANYWPAAERKASVFGGSDYLGVYILVDPGTQIPWAEPTMRHVAIEQLGAVTD